MLLLSFVVDEFEAGANDAVLIGIRCLGNQVRGSAGVLRRGEEIDSLKAWMIGQAKQPSDRRRDIDMLGEAILTAQL